MAANYISKIFNFLFGHEDSQEPIAVRFYVVQNVGSDEPDEVKVHSYIHVKCKASRTHTLIICEDAIDSPHCATVTKDEAQTILNQWIDEENLTPPKEKDGTDIIQPYLSLDNYVS